MKRIGIIGTRRRDRREDLDKTYSAVSTELKEGDRIISGGCPKGGDRFAEVIAKQQGIPITIFYPNWSKYGKGAGFVRNSDIAENSDILIACVATDRTGGTENTIQKFLKKINETEGSAIFKGLLVLV